MKQLVNKFDGKVRLVGLDEARQEGEYIKFLLPANKSIEWCFWRGTEWEIADYNPQPEPKPRKNESKAFRDYLAGLLKKNNYSASGLSIYLGYSHNWMHMILTGKRRITDKGLALLAKELGVAESTLRAKRRNSATIRKDV